VTRAAPGKYRVWAIGASVRALGQSLKRAGYEPICSDQFCDADLQAEFPCQRIASYPAGLKMLARNMEADAFIYTGGLENEPQLIDELAKRMPLWGNGGEVLRQVRDVRRLPSVLASAGFAMPEVSFEPLSDNQIASQRWLRKSQRSAGGLRVIRAVDSETPLRSGEYYQRFVEGICYGAAFIAGDSQASLLGITRQLSGDDWTAAPEFYYCGSIGPVSLPAALDAEVRRLGTFLARQFALQGWFGADLLATDDARLFVLEVNPRYTASIEVLERVSGLATARLHARAFTSEMPASGKARGEFKKVCGKAVLYAGRDAERLGTSTDNLLARAREPGDIADIPHHDEAVRCGQPLLTVFAEGETDDAVERQLHVKGLELRSLLGC
jgi:uncharacterized protein